MISVLVMQILALFIIAEVVCNAFNAASDFEKVIVLFFT